jgi:branched-chain amino acid aminotransferase
LLGAATGTIPLRGRLGKRRWWAKEESMAGQAFHDRDGWVWMDGAFVPQRDAKVHVLTHALHYASCVFEGERAYGGVVFKSREHSQRLIRSARILGFSLPYEAEEIDRAKHELVNKMGFADCYLRTLAWRGSEQLGVSAKANTIHTAIAAWEWGDYFADKMKGIRLMVAPWRRPAPDTAPANAKAAGLYMICTLSKHAAEDAGFNDALMFDWRGQIAEATGANIFFIRDGVIHTPTPDCFLDGLTRQTVIAQARQRGIEVVERAIFPNELATFSECFLTGSAAEITPIREIAGLSFKPGAMCEQAMHDYAALTRRRNAA